MAVIERTAVEDRPNRVHWFSGRVHEVLDDVTAGGVCVSTLNPAETSEAVLELTRATARIEALRLELLAHAERVDVAAETGATSTGSWLAHQARTPHGETFGLVRLARRLDGAFPTTRAALLDGAVGLDQAKVIVDAVDALPAFVGAEDRCRAERHLVEEAARHDAKRLKLLGKRLLHVIDPDAADIELAKQLEREEREAARRTVFRMFDDGNGTCRGSFRIPTLHGAILATALNALASPKRPDAIARETLDEEGLLVQRATPEVLGEAFCQYLELFPTRKLTQACSVGVTVVVTMTLESLLTGLGAASLDAGGYLSAGQARRLACRAGVIPMVLGSESQVLDQGRKTRLHTGSQRIAMRVRDKGCTAEGCTIPAAWCHAHHDIPWSRGGRTSVQNGRMLCPRHHTLVHHPAYQVTDLPGGQLRITRTSPRRQ